MFKCSTLIEFVYDNGTDGITLKQPPQNLSASSDSYPRKQVPHRRVKRTHSTEGLFFATIILSLYFYFSLFYNSARVPSYMASFP